MRPDGFNQGANVQGCVKRQVIHQDNITPPQGRHQHLFNVYGKGRTVHRPFQNPRGLNALETDRREPRIVGARIPRCPFRHALPRPRPAVTARQP